MSAGATSGTAVPVRPSTLKTAKRVSHRAVPGTISSSSTVPASSVQRHPEDCASASPAQDAVSTLSGTMMAASSRELKRARPKGTRSKVAT
ncbi:hypothetical protein ACLESO_31505 [Pyxidicoccus sp. 3LG]